MISSDMALTECRIACCPAARASQTTAGLPAESISDVDGLFGAFGRCGCDDVVRVMRRHCIATQLIEEREQFGGFLLQQDQGTLLGSCMSLPSKTLPSVLPERKQTVCQLIWR